MAGLWTQPLPRGSAGPCCIRVGAVTDPQKAARLTSALGCPPQAREGIDLPGHLLVSAKVFRALISIATHICSRPGSHPTAAGPRACPAPHDLMEGAGLINPRNSSGVQSR